MSRDDICIPLEKALAQRDSGALLIDVRTPAEYADGTIPGAINVPIFDDDERARVGTLYKQEGSQAARRLGVELVSPKIPSLVAQVDAALGTSAPPVLVFCWRGGMRSRAITDFLNLAGIPARQIVGGHKAFRRLVLDFFEAEPWGRLLVLRGLTGVGKTRLLHELRDQSYPVLDLEGLANHRGSAFGAVGLEQQPSQKNFEALLWDEMRRIPEDGYALCEGESRHIGRMVLPKQVYEALQVETSVWVDTPLEQRIDITLEDYPAREAQAYLFERPIRALTERLGKEKVDLLIGYLEERNWRELVRELMVNYYDPLYSHTKPQRRIDVEMQPWEQGVERLKQVVTEILEKPAV